MRANRTLLITLFLPALAAGVLAPTAKALELEITLDGCPTCPSTSPIQEVRGTYRVDPSCVDEAPVRHGVYNLSSVRWGESVRKVGDDPGPHRTVGLRLSSLMPGGSLTGGSPSGALARVVIEGPCDVTSPVASVELECLTEQGAEPCDVRIERVDAAGPPDSDADGVPDAIDDCVRVYDPAQVDSDADGHGNACDADYDGNGLVDMSDFLRFAKAFACWEGDSCFDPAADHGSSSSYEPDGFVGISDFFFFGSEFGNLPGPTGRVDLARQAAPTTGAFSLLAIPDTQNAVKCRFLDSRTPRVELLRVTGEWAAAQTGAMDGRVGSRLAAVLGLGDIVSEGDNRLPDSLTLAAACDYDLQRNLDYQWEAARDALWGPMCEATCCLVVPGDHDLALGGGSWYGPDHQRKDLDGDGELFTSESSAHQLAPGAAYYKFLSYFDDDFYAARLPDSCETGSDAGSGGGYLEGGHYGAGAGVNRWLTFPCGTQTCLAVGTGVCMTPPEQAWVEQVLDRHPEKPTILVQHSYLGLRRGQSGAGWLRCESGEPAPVCAGQPDGAWINDGEVSYGGDHSAGAPSDPGYSCLAGEGVRTEIVEPREQIFLVMGGHKPVGYTVARSRQRPSGTRFVEVLADFQGGPLSNGGGRWVPYVTVEPDDNEICIETIAPNHDASFDASWQAPTLLPFFLYDELALRNGPEFPPNDELAVPFRPSVCFPLDWAF